MNALSLSHRASDPVATLSLSAKETDPTIAHNLTPHAAAPAKPKAPAKRQAKKARAK